MRILLLMVALLALAPCKGQAAAPPISLREAVVRAVGHSPVLAAAGAEIAAAEGNLLSARGIDDFLLDATANWLELRRPLVAGVPVQGPASDDVLATFSLTRPLPSGGRLGLRLSAAYNRTEYVTDLGMQLQQSIIEVIAPSLQLTLQHPLLRGLGPKVARAQVRRAKVQRDAAGLSRDTTMATALRDLTHAYWDLHYAGRELAIRRAAAESAREQLRRVRAQIEVGKLPQSASAEVEVAMALRDEAALLAEQAVLERSAELVRLMGEPATATVEPFDATDQPRTEEGAQDLAVLLEHAVARSPQLALLHTNQAAAQIEVDVTTNGRLPLLDLSFSGGTIGNASDARRAFGQLVEPNSYSVSAGLVFQLPIEGRAARGASEVARQGLRKARLGEEDIRNQITAAVARAHVAAQTAHRRAQVLSRVTDAAALDLAAERARFEAGRASNFDVLRRQEEVAQVQLGQARAQIDHEKSLATLLAISGDILDRWQVRSR